MEMRHTCGALGSGQRGRLGRVRLAGFSHDFDLFFFFLMCAILETRALCFKSRLLQNGCDSTASIPLSEATSSLPVQKLREDLQSIVKSCPRIDDTDHEPASLFSLQLTEFGGTEESIKQDIVAMVGVLQTFKNSQVESLHIPTPVSKEASHAEPHLRDQQLWTDFVSFLFISRQGNGLVLRSMHFQLASVLAC